MFGCSDDGRRRITQVVDVSIGVHAMIPKDIFDEDRRAGIRVVN